MFKLLGWMKDLHSSAWDHAILYADRSSKDKQLLVRPPFVRNKEYERGGQFKDKILILFYGDNS
jgi:hypothetical protein